MMIHSILADFEPPNMDYLPALSMGLLVLLPPEYCGDIGMCLSWPCRFPAPLGVNKRRRCLGATSGGGIVLGLLPEASQRGGGPSRKGDSIPGAGVTTAHTTLAQFWSVSNSAGASASAPF